MTPAYDEAWYSSRAADGIGRLAAYDPGHDVAGMRERTQWLVELGSNENPYGPSPVARAAVLDALHLMHRYPDPRGARLKAALSNRHGVEPERILLGNGSHELLMQFAQVFAGPGADVVYSQYGFAVFALAAGASGATCRVAAALAPDATMPLGHDVEALLRAITPSTRLVYIANPNNPTGTWLDRDSLARFVDAVPADVILVVDEAYGELADAHNYASALTLTKSRPNLVVTRTFSKAYALAGVRCGYAIAAEGLVAVMERVRESFNVNAFALAACEAALADEAHLAWCRERNAEQRSALTTALRQRGIAVLPSQTNFVLAHFGERTGAIEAALVERGVVLRPMAGYGLPDYSRITIGTADENRRLLAALDEVFP
ncbi:histidinol-phosphate transaminase [Cognatilysobacter lacus]|uniref:Histidinol-phosphate aminotransferase n=1 Tax=Cognatilysobacter lacus TaxID=1643323 RepID=A0A5D8Z787_9GAMM|nr:histidinol-phosphate transaminase [Lysobacter lacus]TZF90406.1 histidinol-phosphate transaminase [Lysobacter lacus]